ncbi:hypothetical protein EHEL_101670 [Encephalitozoon hellem ATCC 50504]|uniref:Uncharacterized protein n=1 Tax=Encephalitozoon hellem TaxID=27973 RepID=A0A9Q9C7Y5_ENCHE|nr:uncharacterized protein EHEL_101670 [Encephalitozoon hellem ATCC 50504]AFM99259.1 hypothetical protein EHEL_101670 [Encephalitozoon hellem ATCC 50504]UTX44247.1 hypothetical protein GPU96_10g20390 [Encephalitozoon hellem]|eukprot:XP_003888240.1 hypothetical protein EHEL_101670 [Encephalitozoon hellem ATCC 50504]
MIIFPGGKPRKRFNSTFTLKMLGPPRYDGEFDFSRKKIDIPLIFPFRKSAVRSRNPRQVVFIEKIDDSTVIYSKDGHKFNVVGTYKYRFEIKDLCVRLVTGHQKAFILTDSHMYVYKQKKVSMFNIHAIDLCTSPFGEIFILTGKEILILDETGVRKALPYTGSPVFICFYLYREVIVATKYHVFHLDLISLKLSTIYSTPLKIRSAVLKDRLYIQEGCKKHVRVTSLNIEDRTAESIYIENPMNISVGETTLVLYKTEGEFIFCDRFDLINAKGVAYEVENLLGFFFSGDKSCFFFEERFVLWDNGNVEVVDIDLRKKEDYLMEFPENLEMLEKVHKERKVSKGILMPGKVISTLNEIIEELTQKEKKASKPAPRKKVKYTEKNRGGF